MFPPLMAMWLDALIQSSYASISIVPLLIVSIFLLSNPSASSLVVLMIIEPPFTVTLPSLFMALAAVSSEPYLNRSPVVDTFIVPSLMMRSPSTLMPFPPAPETVIFITPLSIVRAPSHFMPAADDMSLSSVS